MAFATDNSVYDVKSGGRVVVSGDITIAEKIVPDEDLVTLFEDPTHEPLWEVVMTKGTIVSFITKDDGRIVAVPCDSTAQTSEGAAQGVLVQDAFRPFEKGDRAGISFVTGGYVEFPLIDGTGFNNTTLVLGSYVKSDSMGRPVLWESGVDAEELRIGQVKFVEYFGETGVVPATFDYGFLNYLQLPYETFMNALEAQAMLARDPAASVSSTPLFGVRGNLDVADVYGAVRVNLFGM